MTQHRSGGKGLWTLAVLAALVTPSIGGGKAKGRQAQGEANPSNVAVV